MFGISSYNAILPSSRNPLSDDAINNRNRAPYSCYPLIDLYSSKKYNYFTAGYPFVNISIFIFCLSFINLPPSVHLGINASLSILQGKLS